MKILAGLLILAASLVPYMVSSTNDGHDGTATATATAVAVATTNSVGHIRCGHCPYIFKPVCGTDGKTYSNECILKCLNEHNKCNGRPPVFVHRQGPCPHRPCHCPDNIRNPVCGTDRNTYYNIWYLKCENERRAELCLEPIGIAYYGPCRRHYCDCSDHIIPVCGSDNRTYRNICIMDCVSRYHQSQGRPAITMKCRGPCDKDICVCPAIYDPVCGSDKKTYGNMCEFHCYNRRLDQLGEETLIVRHSGKCHERCCCTDHYAPLCASNGVTFLNRCYFDCANEELKDQCKAMLWIKSYGVCPCPCTREYNPVCGSDRKTYSNPCLLKCENKKRKDLGWHLIHMEHSGPCRCDCSRCSRCYEPVCGSDCRTYKNICWLHCQQPCKPNLHLKHYGPC